MAEYDIDFAHEMSKASNAILSNAQPTDGIPLARAAIYCSLVACEVALKAGLEAAGVPLKHIRGQNHDLAGLLKCFDSCCVSAQITSVVTKRVPASRIRSIVVDDKYADATIGKLIEETKHDGASRYPNEIRYGTLLKHYPADVVSRLGEAVVKWVKEHIDDICCGHNPK
ncbi:MAG: hypothetical protein ABL883_14855 [Terricaulis sp.]